MSPIALTINGKAQNVDADPVLVQYIGGNFVTIFPAAVALAEALWPMNA